MAASATTARERVRALNDRLRQHGIGGTIVITPGVRALGPDAISAILAAVTSFSAFDADNDPYGEHDCAVLTVGAERVICSWRCCRWRGPGRVRVGRVTSMAQFKAEVCRPFASRASSSGTRSLSPLSSFNAVPASGARQRAGSEAACIDASLVRCGLTRRLLAL